MRDPEGSGVLADYLERSLGADYQVIAPEMPDAAIGPHYLPWRNQIDSELSAVDGAVVLVGHSFGGSVLLKYLAEGPPPRSVAGLFLVSVPWWGPEGWAYDEYALPADFASRLPAMPTFFYHSREDPHVPFAHLALYEQRLPQATSRPIDGSQHSFTDGLPELVSDIRDAVEGSA
jgi:serine hydrolase